MHDPGSVLPPCLPQRRQYVWLKSDLGSLNYVSLTSPLGELSWARTPPQCDEFYRWNSLVTMLVRGTESPKWKYGKKGFIRLACRTGSWVVKQCLSSHWRERNLGLCAVHKWMSQPGAECQQLVFNPLWKAGFWYQQRNVVAMACQWWGQQPVEELTSETQRWGVMKQSFRADNGLPLGLSSTYRMGLPLQITSSNSAAYLLVDSRASQDDKHHWQGSMAFFFLIVLNRNDQIPW